MAALCLLLCSACGGDGNATPQTSGKVAQAGTFTLTESDCQFVATGPVAPGSLSARVTNNTADRAHFDFWKLNAGHTYAELLAHINEEGRRLRSQLPPLGQPEFASLVRSVPVEKQASAVLTANAAAGTYGMACIRWKLAEEGPLDMYPAGPLMVGE
jgi:hypothetical protein